MNLWLKIDSFLCKAELERGRDKTNFPLLLHSTDATRARTATPPRLFTWLAGAHAGISREDDWKQE